MNQFPESPPESVAPVPVLKLRNGEDRRLRAGHLWVFSNEVDVEATPLMAFESGAVVQVQNARDQFLGYAYVNPHALICARLLSRSPTSPLDDSLLAHRLKQAHQLRQNLDAEPFHRLVYGESDGLPGLVLDRYDGVLVGQIATAGMEVLRPRLEAVIASVLQPQALIWRNNSSSRDLEQLPKEIRVA